MKQSTRKIFKMHGWRLDRALHNLIYFKYYQPYVRILVNGFNWVEKVLSKHDPEGRTYKVIDALQNKASGFVYDRYHGKVLSRSDVTKIIKVEKSVTLGPDTTSRILPFKYAKKILLNEPAYLAVMDCPCKALLQEPCQPLASCIAVGRPLVDLWLEHCRKYHARRISKEEALEIIYELRKTGHYSQAFFKVATGGRAGVICNCCSKCCGGGLSEKKARAFLENNRPFIAEAVAGGGDPMKAVGGTAPSGYTVRHKVAECRLCGHCARICNFSAIEIKEGHRIYDVLACMGCGLCVEHCPNGALTLVYEDKGGFIPLDLDLVRERLGTDLNSMEQNG